MRKTLTLAIAATATVTLIYGVRAVVFAPSNATTVSRPNIVTAHEARHTLAATSARPVTTLEDEPVTYPEPPKVLAELAPAPAAPAASMPTVPVDSKAPAPAVPAASMPTAPVDSRPAARPRIDVERAPAVRPRRISQPRSAAAPELNAHHAMKSFRAGCMKFARMYGMETAPCRMNVNAAQWSQARKLVMMSLPRLP
jgi:hypothetical protein